MPVVPFAGYGGKPSPSPVEASATSGYPRSGRRFCEARGLPWCQLVVSKSTDTGSGRLTLSHALASIATTSLFQADRSRSRSSLGKPSKTTGVTEAQIRDPLGWADQVSGFKVLRGSDHSRFLIDQT